MNINFGVQFSARTNPTSEAISDSNQRSNKIKAARDWGEKKWADLKGDEWEQALAETPYIQSRGDLHVSLLEKFGGFFEHIPTPRREIMTRLAEHYFPVHQVYRWWPPLGSEMFNGYEVMSEFLGNVDESQIKGEAKVNFFKKIGFNMSPDEFNTEKVCLQLGASRRVFLLIIKPWDGDGRYERVPWLASAIEPPFKTGVREWDEVAQVAWDRTWMQEAQRRSKG